MRLQMAHMRRAQCCLSDFCSVSKVTMIDGYFWINKTTFFSLYTCEYIYIYLCVFILKYTRFEKFHWTSSPVITGWERVESRPSPVCSLRLDTLTKFRSPWGYTRALSSQVSRYYHSWSDFPHWLDDGINPLLLNDDSKIHTAPGHDARRNPNNLRIPATIES